MAHAKGQIRVSFVCFNAYKLFNSQSTAQLGGTEVQMYEVATSLSQDSHYRVNFIVGDFGQPLIEIYKNIDVVSSFPLKKYFLNLLFAPLFLFRALHICKPDVIISSPAGPEIGLIALYCLIFPKTKYIFRTASDVDCTGEKERTFPILSRLLYRFGIEHADHIIVQHRNQQSNMLSHYNKRSSIILNGYTLPQHTITFAKKSQRILWVGSSRQVKRADIFFSLVAEFPSYQFDMVLSQSGDKNLYTAHESHARTFPNLIFHGELSPQETNILISQSRILLGTSDYEGSPNTYILASLYGTPIISIRVQSQGICVHGDYNLMKLQIKKIMEDDMYAEQISQKEISYAGEHYNISRVIQNWISVIQEMYYSQKR